MINNNIKIHEEGQAVTHVNIGLSHKPKPKLKIIQTIFIHILEDEST